MEIDRHEPQKRTVWRKYLVHDKDASAFDYNCVSASVHCIREVSGYAVWYRRNLKEEEGGAVADGEYLLGLFETNMKNEAIEFAVLAASPGVSASEAIAALDVQAKSADQITKKTLWIGPFSSGE